MGNEFSEVTRTHPPARFGSPSLHAVRRALGALDWNFINGSIALSAGIAVARILGLAFSLVLARALTPQDYGFIQYSITLAGVIAIGTQPFAQHVLARFTSANSQHGERIQEILNAAWIILLVLFAGTLLVAVPLLAALDQFNVGALVIFAGITLFYTYYGLARGFQANFKLLAAYLASNLVQLVAIVFVVYVLGSRTTLPALLIYGLSYLLPLLLLQVFFPLPVSFRLSLPRRDIVADLLQFSIPIWASHACYILYTGIDLLLLERYASNEAVGVYALSKTLSAVFAFIPMGITTILMPKVASSSSQKHYSLLKNTLLWYVAANAIFLVIYALSYNWVVVRMFGPEYAARPDVFLTVAVATIVFGMHGIISSVLVGSNRPRLETLSLVVGLLAAGLVGFVAVPAYGPTGAAMTMLTGAVLALATYGVIALIRRVNK
jgi:O-antigen/teichoic acid export membrane protein